MAESRSGNRAKRFHFLGPSGRELALAVDNEQSVGEQREIPKVGSMDVDREHVVPSLVAVFVKKKKENNRNISFTLLLFQQEFRHF